MAKRRVASSLPLSQISSSHPSPSELAEESSLPSATPEIRRGLVYLTAALAWMLVVFGSYLYLNYDQVWSKVVELFNSLR